MRATWLVLVMACGGHQQPVDEPVPAPPPPGPSVDPVACDTMAPADCFRSPDCMLGADGACRFPLTDCERGFIQADVSTCACTLAAEPCFCPPDVVCVCGGGLPPMCVSSP